MGRLWLRTADKCCYGLDGPMPKLVTQTFSHQNVHDDGLLGVVPIVLLGYTLLIVRHCLCGAVQDASKARLTNSRMDTES